MTMPSGRVIPFPRSAATNAGAPDTSRFDAIYADHAAYLWRVLLRLGVAESAVDDALQEVFVVVHRQLATFEHRASIRTWLYAIAIRVARDHRRAARRKPTSGTVPESIADERPTPGEIMQRNEALEELHALLERLDEAKREVFVMAELEELTMGEIAEVLGVNVNTLYARLRAARADFERLVAVARRKHR